MTKETFIGFLKKNKADTIKVSVFMAVVIFFMVKSFFDFKKNGVYTVAKVLRQEGASSGANLYLTVFFQNKRINAVADDVCRYCVGKFFFVKVRKDKPNKVVFYYDKPVPDCIMEAPLPPEGWKEIPKCE